jgi:hypothetical protein
MLFATSMRYCGRLITKDGVRFDPKNMEALQTKHKPQNGADLIRNVAAVNWMRSARPNYSKRVAPLQAALAKVFEGKGRRTKKAAAAVSLLHLWGPEVQTFCPDQFSRSSNVDDNSCFLGSSLPSFFYTMSSHRDIYIYECFGIVTQCQRGVDTEAE